jgi:hypothetical protein
VLCYFTVIEFSTSHSFTPKSVGIETRYGMDGPGIESRWGRDFPHQSRPALGAHPVSYTMSIGCFPGIERPGRGVDHLPHLAQRLKRVGLSLYSPLWGFVVCSKVNFTFTFEAYVFQFASAFASDLYSLLHPFRFRDTAYLKFSSFLT